MVWKRQTANQLAKKYRKSARWVRDQLKHCPLPAPSVLPGPAVLIPDTTFFGRDYGIVVCRDPHRKKNIYWQEVASETAAEYLRARLALERQGVIVKAVVIDGRRSLKSIFADVPIQVCQFHQVAIVTRYLTRRPKLEAGKELRTIALLLTELSEEWFLKYLNDWHEKWKDFLKERTCSEDKKHWQYTHRRIRAAFRSLQTNAPYLFTYQKYPELKIPNTTNSLDGYFGRMKKLLNVHNGLSRRNRYLFISEILSK
jgi:hypothetical protein